MATTITAGQSATVAIAAGDTWSVSKTALSEGTFSVVNASGKVKDAGVFGNTTLTTKIYGPYFNNLSNPGTPEATTLTIACAIGSLSYTEIPAAGGGGSGAGGLTPVNKTANYSATTGDSGSSFNNTGASGAVVISLPAAAAGLQYGAYVGAAQTLELLANGTDTINNGGDVSAAGGNIAAATVGDFIWLICNAAGQWSTMSIIGDWTLT